MPWFAILGLALVLVILWDVFETIILPRRVTRRFRVARAFYRATWRPWSFIARRVRNRHRREAFLSFYGPLSLLGLFVVWAIGLIVAFGILHFSAGSAVVSGIAGVGHKGFITDLYMSGTTLFTLGLGDVTPRTELARLITVCEAGIGFGFLALVISYLPVLYGAFSAREANISLLDARAGSPPSASEMLRRLAVRGDSTFLEQNLHDWEKWAAELMESHLSYPVLCYFRSQHDNQSWLAALTTVLDVSAILIAYGQGSLQWQAKLTFAISRHALVDLSQVLNTPPRHFDDERLPPAELQSLRRLLVNTGLAVCCADVSDSATHNPVAHLPESDSKRKTSEGESPANEWMKSDLPRSESVKKELQKKELPKRELLKNDQRLHDLRLMYEPYSNALSNRLLMPVANWSPEAHIVDNWRTSAWARISADIESSPLTDPADTQHF